MQFEQQDDLGVDQSFNLKCRIITKNKSVNGANGKNFENLLIALQPELNDEGTKFFDAWLPTFNPELETQESHECVAYFAPPIDAHARICVCLANRDFPFNHIFLMSLGVRDIIKNNMVEGQVIYLKVYEENCDESILDKSPEAEFNYQSL